MGQLLLCFHLYQKQKNTTDNAENTTTGTVRIFPTLKTLNRAVQHIVTDFILISGEKAGEMYQK